MAQLNPSHLVPRVPPLPIPHKDANPVHLNHPNPGGVGGAAGEEEVIRICVLGASGVGKSSLCNFLCDQRFFKVGDGFDSCTKQSASHTFVHKIDGKQVAFEVTDTPGWFDADGERLPSVHTMLNKISECIKISNTGITAFLLCVPHERISIDTEQSIYFMRDCFDSTQLKHVYLIFTKCRQSRDTQTILNQLQQHRNANRGASKLVYNYAQMIDEQCYATDTVCDDEKEGMQIRDDILRRMNAIYHEHGMIPDGVFQTAQKHFQHELHRLMAMHQQQQMTHQYKYKRMVTLGTVIGVGAIAVGINGYMRYNSLVSQNVSLQQQTEVLSEQTQILNEQTQQLMEQNTELEHSNRRMGTFAGLTEATAGALLWAFEPVSGTIAIFDGLSRVFWNKGATPN